MSGIQRKFIVFVVAVTFWGNAHATTSAETCSARHVEYKNAAEAAYRAFDDLVNITVYTNSSVDKTPYMAKLNQSLTQFLKDSFTYCNPNQTITTENFDDYLNAVKYSMRNVTLLRDLEKDGAFKCILNQKTKINQCVADKVNETINLHNNYSRLRAKSHLNFNSLGCIQTRNVKTCVLNVMKDNSCDKATEYVEHFFDFVLSNHCDKDIPETNASVKITGHWTFFIVVSLWNALALFIS